MKVRMLQDEVGLDVSCSAKHGSTTPPTSFSKAVRGWGERTRASSGGAAPWSAVHNHAPHPLHARPAERRAAPRRQRRGTAAWTQGALCDEVVGADWEAYEGRGARGGLSPGMVCRHGEQCEFQICEPTGKTTT